MSPPKAIDMPRRLGSTIAPRAKSVPGTVFPRMTSSTATYATGGRQVTDDVAGSVSC